MNDDSKNAFPVPDNEQERLNALEQYNILDTLPEEAYDSITKLASYICQVPIAFISLIDANRQWFKSKVGFDVPQMHRSNSFCQYAIMGEDILEISDLKQDKRFATSPLVSGEAGIRFYVAAPLITPDGFALGTLCMLDTKPKKLSKDQMEAIHTLATSVVTQLVLRDQKKKLEEEKDKALQSARVKEQFLANMSHEIRTPLNGIMGLTNLLLASHLTDEQHTYLKYIKNAADNLLGIVNDILDYSKIESGSLTLQSVPFSISQLFESMIQFFTDKAEQKGLEMEASLSQDIPDMLTGDPGRLKQVLSNILDNAIKFTESGKVVFHIHKEWQDSQKITLLFKVTDTGIGIPEEKLSVIFESFTQVNNENSRKYGGTGLGLAIAKRLVDAQAGKLWISSKENEGSTCQVLLSFPIVANTLVQKPGVYSKAGGPVIRVLVAEDNEVNQLIINKVLKRNEFDVTMASNGKLLLEELGKHSFNIILMDIQMPDMDGFEAIKYIRNSAEPYKDIPIIALTAHTSKEEMQKFLTAGANHCISKPFQPDILISKIEELVNRYTE